MGEVAAASRRYGGSPRTGATRDHFRFGVWDNALAAVDFAALLAFGLLSTLLATDAALALVCLVFLIRISLTPSRAST